MILWKDFSIGFDHSNREFYITLEFSVPDWDTSNRLIYYYDDKGNFVRKVKEGKQFFSGFTIDQTFKRVKQTSLKPLHEYIHSISFLTSFVHCPFRSFEFHSYAEDFPMNEKKVSFYLNNDKHVLFTYVLNTKTNKESIFYAKNTQSGEIVKLHPGFFSFEKEVMHHIKKKEQKTRLKFFGFPV